MIKKLYSLLFLLMTAGPTGAEEQDAQTLLKQWHFFVEEQRIQKLHWELSKEFQPRDLAFIHVNLITMNENKIHPDHTVIVTNGKIRSVGASSKTTVPKGLFLVDGEGMFLMPGLTDMHAHNLVSNSQHLLNLANGITTVRDMDGFPWMLEMRKQIASNRLLAPNMYITGQILNAKPMGWYARVVKSTEEGRTIVKQQKAEGYDFIKIHNRMPEAIYSAILEEARRQKMDVVGHIPQELTVRKAIKAGQRTLEHFKGYIIDSRLELTDEDYVAATQGAVVWNCPTFHTYRSHLRGNEARKLVHDAPEMKYVSWRDKQDWLELAEKTDEPNVALRQNILVLSKKIFKDLIPIGAKFLTGTDSGGGYPFMVPGFALQEELRSFQQNGMSAYDTLKASIVNASEAMRKEKEFGTIEIGKRADLVLLRSNPLQDVANASTIQGVAVRGIWMSRSDLDRMLQQIESIYNSPVELRQLREPTEEQLAAFAREQDTLRSQGFVLRSQDLEDQKKLFEHFRTKQKD